MTYNSLLHDLKTLLLQRKVNATLSTITSEEKENLNKILNFAVTWWLKDIDISYVNLNTKDSNIYFVDFMLKSRVLFEEQIERLESFKINLGITLLKTLLISSKDIELHCGNSPYGILDSILIQSNCSFLKMYLPKRTHMTINRAQIWICEEYAAKNYVAFDINNPQDFEKLIIEKSNLITKKLSKNMTPEQWKEIVKKFDKDLLKIMEKNLILPLNFGPSEYDFVEMYMASQYTNIEIETYRRSRKNTRNY